MAKRTPIEPGMVARLVSGVRDFIAPGRTNSQEFFGPGEPPAPIAPPDTAGRQFDFPAYVNTQQRPRVDTPTSFDDLRNLADQYDLLRLIIETRKDQMEPLQWQIVPKEKNVEPDARCKAIFDFFCMPDKQHTWAEWLRILLEDLMVIDAPAIYPRFTRGGELYALEPIDGATIKRVLDYYGRTPLPPNPAYQQILKGMPAIDYTSQELLYKPRNMRSYRIYGFSPVEQIIMTVNIALRRQINQLEYYTKGNVPNLIFSVPETWGAEEIAKFQLRWDQINEGGIKSNGRFVPHGVQPYDTKPPALKDEFDEWLARVVCFAFSVEPTPFVKQTNRATSETAREQSLAEGLRPLKSWVKSLVDQVIAQHFGATDIEFRWIEDKSVDPLTQAQINGIYLDKKVYHPDEVRVEQLGLKPMDAKQRAELANAANDGIKNDDKSSKEDKK